jgi:hypothetical protein
MPTSDLSREQLAAMFGATRRTLQYLNKLLKRMQQRYFPNDDPAWIAALEAQRAMLKLVRQLEIAESQATTETLHITVVNKSGYRLGRPRKETHSTACPTNALMELFVGRIVFAYLRDARPEH